MNRYQQQPAHGLNVTFSIEAVEDTTASETQGRPIYREVEHVQISGMRDASGGIDNTTVIKDVASALHKKRFAFEYQNFLAERRQPVDGTPLSMWPAVSIAGVKELAHFGLFTVEQLAEVESSEIRKQPWLEPHALKAKAWLDSVAENGEALRLAGQVAELTATVQRLEAENLDLRALHNESKKRSTRSAQ